jgi:hypothetical protein
VSNKIINWLPEVEPHDYSAANSYLSLVSAKKEKRKIIAQLKRSKIELFKAKDLFRASSLSLLGVSNSHVLKDLKKIKSRTPLSPLLIVTDPVNRRLIIADGYHRLCAVYATSEDELIPCKITYFEKK